MSDLTLGPISSRSNEDSLITRLILKNAVQNHDSCPFMVDMSCIWSQMRPWSCQSADMASLCGVRVHVRVHLSDFCSKSTRPRDLLLTLKDNLIYLG